MGDNYKLRTLEETFSVAIDRQARVIVPKSNEVFVDIDNEEDMPLYSYHVRMLRSIGLISEDWYTSKTPGHRHIILGFNREISNMERLAIAAMCGSDRMHELLGLLQLDKNPHPQVFFEYTKEPNVPFFSFRYDVSLDAVG